MPDEPFDIYTDNFTITITPFGANLSFALREPHPAQARTPQSTTLGTVRMSVEHLKLMTVVMKRQVALSEEQSGIPVQVPYNILNQLGISPEDWEDFWK